MKFKIETLRKSFIDNAREHNLDDQNQPVMRLNAEGGEPLRDALRRAKPGEPLIAASYCPFDQQGPFREFGPVYILANPTDSPPAECSLPVINDNELDYFVDQHIVRAYGNDESIVDAELIATPDAEQVITSYLSRPDVNFVMTRFHSTDVMATRYTQSPKAKNGSWQVW